MGEYIKTVIVDAIQFKVINEITLKYGVHKEYNEDEVIEFAKATGKLIRIGTEPNGQPEGLTFIDIPTSKGTMRANVDDWIIRGVDGEIYPCEPDIFEKTYREVYVGVDWAKGEDTTSPFDSPQFHPNT